MKFGGYILILVVIIGLHTKGANAQIEDVGDDEIITIETKSVHTTLRLSNSKGKPQFIQKEDIRLFVDGQPQEIAYFAANRINKFIILLDASSSIFTRISSKLRLKFMAEYPWTIGN